MVATAGAGQVPARLAHLVYLDAFVPEDGQSLLDMAGPEVAVRFEAIAHERGDGWRIPHDPPDAPRRTAHPRKTFQGRVAVDNPTAAALPRTSISCSDKPELSGGRRRHRRLGGAGAGGRLALPRAADEPRRAGDDAAGAGGPAAGDRITGEGRIGRARARAIVGEMVG